MKYQVDGLTVSYKEGGKVKSIVAERAFMRKNKELIDGKPTGRKVTTIIIIEDNNG